MSSEKQKSVLDRSLLKPLIRQRIEEAVLDLFSEREFRSVGFGEIASAANVSLQTIYKYYGSKDALLFACLETWLGTLASRMLDHLQGIESCQDKLRKVFWVVLDFFDRNPKVSLLIMNSLQISAWGRDRTFRQPEMMEVLMKTLSDGRAQGVLTDEVDEKILLDYFIGILERLVHMHTMRGEPEALALQSNALFKMLWRAIARPEQA
ncbi:bacterial regulatory s, tetR family protein [Collimonas arenae]|uniref:Bacterial regulatory s, tetR family protein n=1 Tax=Collimonas arenae TaxID=279058 RepID=A0A127PTE7_9BURK|nr:TetR/AcrR family transcriptional regulator [Collimonas arenae]AMP01063.1 bacterial regulatory s, tetR family protein [Collimonas arenae]AMP10959.1 bacterial regulatory s, tetR family protein [Collimonas arenae]